MKTLNLPEVEEKCFERLVRLIGRLNLSHPLIFDVGANIGQSIDKFRGAWPDASIHCFEANPSVFQYLHTQYAAEKDLYFNPVALSERIGELSFFATRVAEVSSLLSPTQRMQNLSVEHKYDYEEITVPSETLDHYCETQHISRIDLLKIDVQGAELSVLKGAQGLLSAGAVSMIYLETTFADCYENQTLFTDLLVYLSQVGEGYELWDIAPFLYTGRDQLWAANSIFLSKSIAGELLK